MTLTKTDHPGTGNSKVTLPKKRMVELNNTPINKTQVKTFLEILKTQGFKVDNVKVNISNRKTTRRWGTASHTNKKVTLYRHSVWIFLHELTHLIEPPKRVNGRRDIHGVSFGKALTDMAKIWMKEMTAN